VGLLGADFLKRRRQHRPLRLVKVLPAKLVFDDPRLRRFARVEDNLDTRIINAIAVFSTDQLGAQFRYRRFRV
jgi:hypothetical protein